LLVPAKRYFLSEDNCIAVTWTRLSSGGTIRIALLSTPLALGSMDQAGTFRDASVQLLTATFMFIGEVAPI
jgi:ABC-type taurine transport system substrate-binding protein